MNRNDLVTHLRRAKRSAQQLTTRNTPDTDGYQAVIESVDAALTSLGESTADHISPNLSVRSTGDTSVGRPRFGRTPPDLLVGAPLSQKVKTEKKSAASADPNSDEAVVEAAVASGQIQEVDVSEELIAEIASSSNAALVKRFDNEATIQAVTKELGGEPDPEKTINQQAGILKKAAKAKAKK